MKILVYGAGALGSLCAAHLSEAGHEVSLLARGQRLADLRSKGVLLENLVTHTRTTSHPDIVEQLGPQDAYDLVIVVMGKHQITPILPILAANQNTPNVLFVGNNFAGPEELVSALGRERVLLGFYLAAGVRTGAVVHYAEGLDDVQRRGFVIGEIDGSHTSRLDEIAAAFAEAHLPVEISSNIDAWLKSHAALIVPLGAVYYLAGNDIQRLIHHRSALLLLVRAVRESFQVLQAHHIPLLPPAYRVLRWVPEELLVAMIKRMLANPLVQHSLGHAGHIYPEIRKLSAEMRAMTRTGKVPTPALECLFDALNTALPQMPTCDERPLIKQSGVWVALLLAVGLILLVMWLRRR